MSKNFDDAEYMGEASPLVEVSFMDFAVDKNIVGESPLVTVTFMEFDVGKSILDESSLIEICPNVFDEDEYM